MRAVAILPAKNEEERIGSTISELQKLPLHEIVVVANGCKDDTALIAKRHGARVVTFRDSLGHDVARAVGAANTEADVYLFTDGDLVCPARQLAPFLEAVAGGVDVALNDLNALLDDQAKTHVVNICKAFLSYAMGAPELGANSLTAVPHCLSRKAIEHIGPGNLMVPPKALLIAYHAGLRIKAVGAVDVISRNRVRRDLHRHLGFVDELIIGDHLEALAELVKLVGDRGKYKNDQRTRQPQLERGV